MTTSRHLLRLILAGLLACSQVTWAQASKPGFEQLFNEFDVTMLLIDPGNGQIVDANPQAARFYGHSQDTLRSMTIQQINTFSPEQVAAERSLAASEGRNYFLFRHRLANNDIRTVEVHSQPFIFAGNKLLLSIVNDITPGRHQAQDLWHYQQKLEEMVEVQVREIARSKRQQTVLLVTGLLIQTGVILWLVVNIRRRQSLERERATLIGALQLRNQELGRLGEAMAHHFQEPVRRLASFAQRLLTRSDLAKDDDTRLSLGFINAESKRLSMLVSDAQRYLALDRNQIHSTVFTDATDVLTQVIADAGSTAAEARIEVHEPLPSVTLASKPLHDLFAVLLDNALRYRHPERPLHIDISARVQDNRAVFRVTDNGSGIEPAYREQVLGMFKRLVPSSMPGTGMGLALANKIVSLAGGQLHLEDGAEGGVCVVFDLPMETE